MAEQKNQDKDNQSLNIEEFSGTILSGLNSLTKAELSIEEFQSQFIIALGDEASAFNRLERAERLELAALARASSPEVQQALEASYGEIKAHWSQALETARSELTATNQEVSNTKLLSRALNGLGELSGAAGSLSAILDTVALNDHVQAGESKEAGSLLLQAAGSIVAGAFFVAMLPPAATAGAVAISVATVGAISYGITIAVTEAVPDEWKSSIGDILVETFNRDIIRQRLNQNFREDNIPRYLKENVQSTIADVGAENLSVSDLETEFLGDIDPSVLAEQARTDPVVRYALVTGHFFAIRNDLSIYNDADLDIENFTDEYLLDRAEFINTFFAFGLEENETVYIDYESQITAGAEPLSGWLNDQVVFGSDRGELLEGGAGSDRLYGGGGHDTLVGGSKDDYLEGNEGEDRLEGDEGNDTLIGGKDNDELLGGTGHDEYHFSAGDGADTIFDMDGQGEILIDGETKLEGTDQAGSQEGGHTVWESADGQYVYTLVDGTLEEGTLEITSPGLDAGDKITISEFHNGDLGIELSSERTLTLAPGPFPEDGSEAPAESTTLAEGGARPFRVELNRPAEAGDQITLTLVGEGAETVVVRQGSDVLSFADGEVTLTLEESQQSIDFSVVSEGDLEASADLNLEAVYENSDGNTTTDPVAVTITLEADETPDEQLGGDQTIVGDYVWATSGSGADVVYEYDALGNRVYETPLALSYGQNDVLQDGDGNSRLYCGPDKDTLECYEVVLFQSAREMSIGSNIGIQVVIRSAA